MKKYILMLAVAACGLVACTGAKEENKEEAKAPEQTEAPAENNCDATCENTECEATEGEATEGEATEGEATEEVAEVAVSEN